MPSRSLGLVALLTGLVLSGPLAGQQQQAPPLPSPRLLTISPLGGKQGTTVEVTVTGNDLDEPTGLLFSVPGFKVEIAAGAAATPAPMDPKKPAPKPGKPAPMAAATRFKVTIPAGAPVGIHDVRVINKWGVTNPRAFTVGDLNEVLEKEPNNDVPDAQRVELNSTVNGGIGAPTDVDYYVFAGKKGQRVVASCRSSSIDSRLPAAMQLFTANGAALALNRQYERDDALLDATLPEDGDYVLRVFSFTYTQGGVEHFYRLTLSTAPWIDAIFPPVVQPGKPAEVTVYGRNLPGGQPDPNAVVEGRILEKLKVKVTVPAEVVARQQLNHLGHVQPSASSLDGFTFRLKGPTGHSNPYLLTVGQAPVVTDSGDNDTPEKAQQVALPCEIGGWIEKRSDKDWYSFTAKKGDAFSIEAFGDRLGMPMDLYYAIRREEGKHSLGEFDENPLNLNATQFFTRTDDPARQRFVAPEDGRYHVMITSREASLQHGPRHLYRLRITPERPDFRLVLMPPMANTPEGTLVQRGGKTYFNVYVWRLDGFNGSIVLTAEGLPAGVTCAPQTLGAGLTQAALVLTAKPDAADWTGAITVRGTATINGQKVTRDARAATISWPAAQGQVALSRLDRALVLAVRDKAPYEINATNDKFTVQLGEKVAVPLKIARYWPDAKGQVQVTALGLPANVVVTTGNQPINLPAGKDDATVAIDVRPTAPPGVYTIVLRTTMVLPFNKDPKGKPANALAVQPSTPITLTILPKQVATIGVTPAKPTVKPGQQVELVVNATRQFEFEGPFKVELIIPPTAKGLSAAAVTIPAGKNEAKLVLKADAAATPGNKPNLLLRATAQINEKVTATHEVKLSVDVLK